MIRPPLRKHLGQHHLTAGSLCRPLVEFLRPQGERLVEIGPGGGVLTAELLAAGARRVLALELDRAWAFALRGALGGAVEERRLVPVVADALDLDWHRLPSPTLVAGNLPYGIATRLLVRLLPCSETVPRAAFLVQREVAERLLAAPGDSAYGALSVHVACCSEAHLLGRVRRGSFRPPPKVEGAFVGFRLVPPPLPPGELAPFQEVVRLAFGQRRKTLRNALAAGWGTQRAAAVLERSGIPPRGRAQELGLEELLRLYRASREEGTAVAG